MKRGLWIVVLFICVFCWQLCAQTELTQKEMEKMILESGLILEGKLEKTGAHLYKARVSEIFQGLQRVKNLNISLDPDQARLYLFSMDEKYYRGLNRRVSEKVRDIFKKNGHSLEAGELKLTVKKRNRQWMIDNRIKIQGHGKTENFAKNYIIERKSGGLEVYTPLQQDGQYILFLEKQGKGYALAPFDKSILKSDLFLPGRVREAALKRRMERSDLVVRAKVTKTEEKEQGDKIHVIAKCKSVQSYKEEAPEEFEISYYRVRQVFPPMVILFDHLEYVFFLKKPEKDNSRYRLLNVYEGAYPQERFLLKDLENQAKNPFDQIAGKPHEGLRNYARLQISEIKKGEPAVIEMMLLNVSQGDLEIYHNQVAYFTLFHILDEHGKVVAAKYPRVVSIPPVQKRHFISLDPGGYIVVPPFDLQEFCDLQTGHYTIYIEFHLPLEYTGKTIGKSAWAGKAMSNKLELTVTE